MAGLAFDPLTLQEKGVGTSLWEPCTTRCQHNVVTAQLTAALLMHE